MYTYLYPVFVALMTIPTWVDAGTVDGVLRSSGLPIILSQRNSHAMMPAVLRTFRRFPLRKNARVGKLVYLDTKRPTAFQHAVPLSLCPAPSREITSRAGTECAEYIDLVTW